MTPTRRQVTGMTAAALLAPQVGRAEPRAGVIVAETPSPTRAAFDLAIRQGADFLAAGVIASQDGALVAAPDLELSRWTDVAARPEFAARRTRKTLGGAEVEGWFSDDFALADLKTLQAGGSPPRVARPAQAGAAPASVLTIQELIDIARAGSVREARIVGLAPVLIRPGHFSAADLALEPRLAELIRANGYNWPAAAMIVQAFEAEALTALGALSRVRRTQLFAQAPPAADLAAVRAHAEGIGVNAAAQGGPAAPAVSDLAVQAHNAGLTLFVRASGPRAGLAALFGAGVDGLITEDPALAVKARNDAVAVARRRPG